MHKIIVICDRCPVAGRSLFLTKGVRAVLTKNNELNNFVDVIRLVNNSEFCFSENKLSGTKSKPIDQLEKVNFTIRELELLELLCAGKTHKEISIHLSISLRTVNFHKANIYRKSRVSTNSALVAFCYQNGFV
jgi:DNA-binding NarL/FixJ family response regulator